jgi:hypothetical protein
VLVDRNAIALACEESGIDAARLPLALKSAQAWLERLNAGSEASALAELAERVDLSGEGIRVSLKLSTSATRERDGASSDHIALAKFRCRSSDVGIEMRMVLEGDAGPRRIDLPLLKAVARARKWSDDLISGRVQSVDELAKRERVDGRSVRRLIPLGFLSPRRIEAIAEGRQSPDLIVIGDHLIGTLVRMEYRIEHLNDHSVLDDEDHTL